MSEDKPHQGNRFLETLTTKKVTVRDYNHRGDEVVELDDGSQWPIDQFNQRFKYLYGGGDITFLSYLMDSLIARPDLYKAFLEIAKEPMTFPNSPSICKSEYVQAAYNCLEEAFDNCWNPEEEHKSWSAIREMVSACSEDNDLVAIIAAEYLTPEYINRRKDIVFQNSTRIDLAGQCFNRKNKSSQSKK